MVVFDQKIFLVSFFTWLVFFSFFFEIKRNRVYAITLPCWSRSIFKDMAQMASAAGTDYFDPVHEITGIFFKLYPITRKYIIETWPARSRLKFGIRGKKLLPAGSTGINSFFLIIVQVA